ncbi:MAG: DUF1345 domain-containing protein [Phyllobacterium sp.]
MTLLLRRHIPFYIAAFGGATAFLASYRIGTPLAPVIGANVFFTLYLLLTLIALPRLTAAYLKKHAASADEPVWIIFLVTIGTIIVAVVSLFILVNSAQNPGPLNFAVTLTAVPLGWLTIHMMTAIHYAHAYWQPNVAAGSRQAVPGGPRGGFDFPGTPQPSAIEFVYFSYVIGMTAQTSDVNVTNAAMRSITLIHSIVSFFFNTVLVAAAVNVAVTLGQ